MTNALDDAPALADLLRLSRKRTRAALTAFTPGPAAHLDDPRAQRAVLAAKFVADYRDSCVLPVGAAKPSGGPAKLTAVAGASTTSTVTTNNARRVLAITAAGAPSASSASAPAPPSGPAAIGAGSSSMALIPAPSTAGAAPRAGALAPLGAQRDVPRPQWHAPWKLMRVISGHTGWVRAVAVDVSNEWFVTGGGDRLIKLWDLASGTLKLTLTGHIACVRGLAVSDRHPYMFSAAEDKTVKCWDLETNKAIRQYHGHLSGVYALALHPTIDILATGGRDSTVRVWDMRSKHQAHVLNGHTSTVGAILMQSSEYQLITGSHDSTVKLWDLRMGKCKATLTHHKKSVRALAMHPTESTFASGSPDNIKQWVLRREDPGADFPACRLVQNFAGHEGMVNALAVNDEGVMFSGGDNGSMRFWDWRTGHCFQKGHAQVQPGSLDSEAGVFAATFDRSGSRLITCEADKSIKIWREDPRATPESHPVVWQPELKRSRY
ncbi:WD40-repeat-containing domain protein [Blastocladiella britannica]|nr:WD40-repeat-containing domain protein [Blastocladiella britannica]